MNAVGLIQLEECTSVLISVCMIGVNTGRGAMVSVVHTVRGAVHARGHCKVQSEIMQGGIAEEN